MCLPSFCGHDTTGTGVRITMSRIVDKRRQKLGRQKKQKLKKRADGRYCCRWKDKQFMGHTEDEALQAREAYKRAVLSGLNPSRITFSQYAETWLKSHKNGISERSRTRYKLHHKKFIESAGDKPLSQYIPSDISQFFQHYTGKSSSSILQASLAIGGVFRSAVADRIILSDPTQSIKPPKGTHGTHRAITQEERQAIHNTSHRLRPAVMVMLYAGLRKGEAIALNIDRDVDFENRLIHVREAVHHLPNGQPEITSTKTEAGVRTIPLLDTLANELRGLHGLLCTSAKGLLMSDSAFDRAWQNYLKALSQTAGKPVTIRTHDLRHSFCTMLYDAGIDVKSSMLWMGHANETMTMRIYTHLSNQKRTEAENALRQAEKKGLYMQNDMQSLPDPSQSQ